MSIDNNWQPPDNNDELALLNEELMLMIALHTLGEATAIEDSQASQGHKAKITGNTNKYKLLSSAAIIIASASLFTPDYAFADDQDLAAENARLRQELEAARKENQSLKKTLKVEDAPVVEDTLAEPQTAEETLAEEAAVEENKTKDLGEVVVRAQPRLKRLKEVPVSASVRTGEELSRELAFDMDQILKRSGNVRFNPGNSRTNSLSLRGIGRQPQTDAMDPSVGTVFDGVPYSYNPLTSFDQYDLATVQVDRGPTGTDFGKNYNQGRIVITPRHPSFTPDANFSLTYGDFDTYIADAAGGGAVIDNILAWRGAIHVNKAEGHIKNLQNPDQTWYNRDRAAGRIQLLLTPSEDFSARLSFDMQPTGGEHFNNVDQFLLTPQFFADGSINNSLTPERRLARRWFRDGDPDFNVKNDFFFNGKPQVNVDSNLPVETRSKGGLVDLNWDIGDLRLTSITALRDYRFRAKNDEGTPFDVDRGLFRGGDVPRLLHLSQEFRVSSHWDEILDYQAGALYLKRSMDKDNWSGWGKDAGAWYARNSQYAQLDADNNGRQLMADSLDGLIRWKNRSIENDSASIFGNGEWHVTDSFSVTTGFRVSYEKREQKTQQIVYDNGSGGLLNDSARNGVQLGGFDADNNGNLTAGAQNDPSQVAVANALAQKYFGVENYTALSEAQKNQVGAAKAIRNSRLGNLWLEEPGNTFEDIQPTFIVSPSFKFNENLTSYVSWRFSQKPGISQTPNGVALRVKEETANAFEIGFKSSLFNNTLDLHADFFWTEIDDYQQPALVLDEFTTRLEQQIDPNAQPTFISATGNAAGVRAMGVEIDAFYTGIPYTTVNFSGAWTDAYYSDFKNAVRPVEQRFRGAPVFYDATGENLPGAAQFTFTVSPEFRYPVNFFGSNEFHASFTTFFSSDFKSDNALSEFSVIKSFTNTDFSVGVGRADKKFDISLVGKNIFDNQTPIARTWNSFQPALPQWFGVRVSSAF